MADGRPMERDSGEWGAPSNRGTVRRLLRFVESQTPAATYEPTRTYGPAHSQTRGQIAGSFGGDGPVAQTTHWEPARPPARPAEGETPRHLASEDEGERRGRRRPEPSAAAEVRELREIVAHEASLADERANILYQHIEDRFDTLIAAQEGDRELKVATLDELRVITQLLRGESGKRHPSTSTTNDHDSSPESSEPATPKVLLPPTPTHSDSRTIVGSARTEQKRSRGHESRRSKDKRDGEGSKEKDKDKREKEKERQKRENEKEQERRDKDNDKERERKKKDKHEQAGEEVPKDASKLVGGGGQGKVIGSISSTDWQGGSALDGYA